MVELQSILEYYKVSTMTEQVLNFLFDDYVFFALRLILSWNDKLGYNTFVWFFEDRACFKLKSYIMDVFLYLLEIDAQTIVL